MGIEATNGAHDPARSAMTITESRAELRRLLHEEATEQPRSADAFPRSKTMRFLKSRGAIGLAAAVAGGVLLAKPGLAVKALRIIPVNMLVRVLTARLISARLRKF